MVRSTWVRTIGARIRRVRIIGLLIGMVMIVRVIMATTTTSSGRIKQLRVISRIVPRVLSDNRSLLQLYLLHLSVLPVVNPIQVRVSRPQVVVSHVALLLIRLKIVQTRILRCLGITSSHLLPLDVSILPLVNR